MTKIEYKCSTCGVSGVKLWREYQTFLEHQTLECVDCAIKSQKKDISVAADGTHERTIELGHGQAITAGRSDQIGWRVPAVPTVEGDTFWGYTSVPSDRVAWWKALPLRTGGKAA